MPELAIWTIYKSPTDFPGKFVARKHVVGAGSSRATDDHYVADSLADARGMIPPFLHNLGRQPGDDPVIVESWI